MGKFGQAWKSGNSCNPLVLEKNGSKVGLIMG